jgi:hypothetical protein
MRENPREMGREGRKPQEKKKEERKITWSDLGVTPSNYARRRMHSRGMRRSGRRR